MHVKIWIWRFSDATPDQHLLENWIHSSLCEEMHSLYIIVTHYKKGHNIIDHMGLKTCMCPGFRESDFICLIELLNYKKCNHDIDSSWFMLVYCRSFKLTNFHLKIIVRGFILLFESITSTPHWILITIAATLLRILSLLSSQVWVRYLGFRPTDKHDKQKKALFLFFESVLWLEHMGLMT